ncbi:MAG: ATP-binding cassette domain-containing protein [Peptococcaceae bacterium]|nr:ATP-binding cassette domain-containing protein [Peptococcaceae bacterium]
MIMLKGISKAYTDNVLKGISYQFEAGKIYVIKGVSGCGKSTLLNILGGLETDYSGEYLLDGMAVKSYDKKQFEHFRRKIGYVFQNSLLISNLTIRQNLLFIKNVPELIEEYAGMLKVSHLLDKFPEQLSGGERQRISFIRALINSPSLILADEPTASLDNLNSWQIAEMLRSISNAENCLIIATHENCFDNIADEIICLDYGIIGKVTKNRLCDSRESNLLLDRGKQQTAPAMSGSGKKFSLLKFIMLRNSKMKSSCKARSMNPLKLLPTTLILLVLLFCLAVQNNAQAEYIKSVEERYPLTVFCLAENQYNDLSHEYDIFVYDNYVIPSEEFACLPLFYEKDSGLSYGGVIKYGDFPESFDEIIVNAVFLDSRFQGVKYEDCFGMEVIIDDQMYRIAGIITDDLDDTQVNLVFYNVYYQDYWLDDPLVFMPYDTIKQRGELVQKPAIMVRFDGLYDDKAAYESVKGAFHNEISIWDAKVNTLKAIVNFIFAIILLAVGVLSIIALLFLKNEIQLELHYRRREIGYLQVFNVGKGRVRKIIILERMLKNVLALICAVGFYGFISLLLSLIAGINLYLPAIVIGLFAAIVLAYSYLVVYLPCRKFLRQSIIDLISK